METPKNKRKNEEIDEVTKKRISAFIRTLQKSKLIINPFVPQKNLIEQTKFFAEYANVREASVYFDNILLLKINQTSCGKEGLYLMNLKISNAAKDINPFDLFNINLQDANGLQKYYSLIFEIYKTSNQENGICFTFVEKNLAKMYANLLEQSDIDEEEEQSEFYDEDNFE